MSVASSRSLVVGLVCTLGLGSALGQNRPTDWVSPLVGSDGHGHTYPGSVLPFGMVQLSPDTRTDTWDGCSGYHYSDSVILGFSHTHLSGTGAGCLGDILLMPTVGSAPLNAGTPGNGYASKFSHSQETASPGYYKVFLQTPKVTAEMTSTYRVGVHRYTFPASQSAHIVVDLAHGVQNDVRSSELKIENSTTLSGFRRSSGWGGDRVIFFVMKFSKPFLGQGTSTKTSGVGVVQALDFHTKAGESIVAKVGISGTSVDGARKNLDKEVPGWDFDKVHAAARKTWDNALANVKIESPDPHIKRTFYTNLYLAELAPTLYNDVDGAYMGMDHKIHRDSSFNNYTTFSLWDTYRALHPLMTLLLPDRVTDMVQSLLHEYQESGYHSTPVWPLWGNETWCMIGYHSVPVIVDAYLKGFKGIDGEAAYRAMKDTSNQNRFGLASYKQLGYDASKTGECGASKTLEYAFDDWCLAKMATKLGHTEDAAEFYKRAGNYRNIFDRTSQFMRGRKANGTWRSPFDTHGLVNDEYTEADAYQYAFAVQQDVPGLIDLYGGDQGFIHRMDEMFAADPTIHTNIPDITGLIGQFSQGDEQCHHVSYLYDYAGAPWKTQERVRQVMKKFYDDTPAGQCGNVDCGQMSAWYVFSAMGFYPVNPASGTYEIGSPLLSRASVEMSKGRKFTVIAENNGPKNIYIQSATLNGKPFNRVYVTQKELEAGATLRFVMGPKPSKWASARSARPAPTMPANFAYAALPTPAVATNVLVKLELPIRIVCGSDDPVGNFIGDPNMLDGMTNAANTPVDTSSASNPAPEGVYQSERYGSDFTYKFPVPAGSYTVRLHFAEIFNDTPGQRIETISLNGEPVLKKFDAAESGQNKAVVKEFHDIHPNAKGEIRIRVQADPKSPDQNAKISGIEILPQ